MYLSARHTIWTIVHIVCLALFFNDAVDFEMELERKVPGIFKGKNPFQTNKG
jgi:hypothetical protein